MLEGLVRVVFPVWECILVEDTKPEHRASIYGTISAVWNIGSLFTPLAGYLISLHGIDFGCRMVFTLAFASMVPMYMIRQILLRETELGYQIMKEKSFAGMKGYPASLSIIRKNRILAALLLISVVGSFYYAVTTYLPLYLINERGIGLSEDIASLIPTASSTSALIIALLVVPKLTSRSDYIKALASGYGIGCVAILLLVYTSRGYLPSTLVSGALLGIYYTTAFSVSRTFLTNEIEAVDSKARAKILSITIMLSSPKPT